MQTYTFLNNGDRKVVVEAESEEHARTLAMIQLHGQKPDDVIPEAPAYKGLGLFLVPN